MTHLLRRAVRASFFALVLALPAASVVAQETVFYRCTDASGAVTLQNGTPCAKGSKQEKRVIQGVPSGGLPSAAPPAASPAPAPAPIQPATAPVAPVRPAPKPTASVVADEDRLPPPALFKCRTYDNGRYLSDDGQPPPRCAPVAVTGLDGTNATAAGSACQMVTDQCQRIVDGELCGNWKQRLREAESQLRFGTPAQRDNAQADVERMRRIVSESSCAN